MNDQHRDESARKQEYLEAIQALQSSRQFDKAAEYAEMLCSLDPANGEFPLVAGMLYLSAGRQDKAIQSFFRGLSLEPGNPWFRTYFTHALLTGGITSFDPEVKRWLGIFLQEPQTVPIDLLAKLWHYHLVHDPDCSPLLSGIECTDDDSFASWIEALPPQHAALLADNYFTDGLRSFIVADMGFEIFLTRLRRAILGKINAPLPWMEKLASALAEQCFINEYVFQQTEAEAASINLLTKSLSSKGGMAALTVAVCGCYKPLHAIPAIRKSAQRLSNHPVLAALVRQQITDPELERKLQARIPSVSRIRDKVSRLVQDQYEENPYPRWVSVGPFRVSQDQIISALPENRNARAILVAGCGTGSHPITVCLARPEASITGVDLSRASLAYARRKADEMGIGNLTLFQGDILELEKLGKTFDLIECAGVLHHMQDPERGWGILTRILKPGGLMRIALYSKTARRYITEAQNDIRARGIPATPEGIRRCRAEFFALPPDHPYRSFMIGDDFYSTSMVRDLLFHVQEQCFTIPRIERDLEALGLEFLGFTRIDSATQGRYRQLFPDDPTMTNPGNWDRYEQLYPDTFISMYKFWCRKKPSK